MEYDSVPDFPDRFAEPLRRSARGAEAVWPASMSAHEREAIAAHGMLPIVRRLAALETRSEAVAAAAIEALRLVDLQEVLSALAKRGILPLCLKGTALSYTVYEAPELRPRTDVDLLVDRSDVSVVRAAFVELGFETRVPGADEFGYRQQLFGREDGHGLRHAYDVHWDITNNAVTAEALRYRELRDRAQALDAISSAALGLSDVDALIYACIHRAVHHHGSGRLVWLYDVHLLRQRMGRTQHEEFWRRAAERRVLAICRDTVESASSWFGGGERFPPAEFLTASELGVREQSSAFLEPGRRAAAVLAADLGALPGWSARLRRLWQLAFPPAAYLLQDGHSRAALPWLWARRGVRGVGKLFRRVRG